MLLNRCSDDEIRTAAVGVGWVNDRLTAAPEGATWSLSGYTAAGRAAAEVGACALPDAPPSRRGHLIAKTGSEISVAITVICPVFGLLFCVRLLIKFSSIYVDVFFPRRIAVLTCSW